MPTHAQLDMMQAAFEMLRASENVDAAVEAFTTDLTAEQPACFDPTKNYVKCFSVPDDVDDTEIVVHPIVPEGTVLGDLAESSPDDYVMGKAYFEAVRDVISTCEATDKYQLATYPWLDSNDFTTPNLSVSLVKDFVASDGNTYVCSSGPISEEEIEMAAEDLKPSTMHDLIPEFKWTEAPPGVDYDFSGSLEMCGGLATKMDWPSYFVNEETSGAIFAYRQYGNHQGLNCGDEMAPVMHLKRGKVYKINFINSSESDTNLHTHGLHLGGNGWSDDVFRTIPAGMCGVYYWEIHPEHISGMHWYHPHLHEWTFEQVRGRAFGPLFVDEEDEVTDTYPPSVKKWLESTILVQLSTETVPSPMTNGDGVKDGRCPGGFDDCYPRANNKRQETVVLVKNEWTSIVLHSVVPNGTGLDVVKFFAKDGLSEAPCVTMVSGYDGVYRSSVPRAVEDYPEEPNYFHANGASRLQLAVKCSDDATLKFGKEDSTDSHYGMKTPEEAALMPVVIVFKTVEGEVTNASPYADEETMTQWIPPRPFYLEDLTTYTGEVETWELITEIDGMGTGSLWDLVPLFNGKSFHGGDANHVATYEAVQEWSYYGSAAHPDGHPMHVHVNHVQIYGHSNMTGVDCGPNLEFGQWYDTLRIKESDWDPCLARFRFNDYSGKVIMHCHDLLHEDAGMMGWVMVEGGPNDEEAVAPVKEPVECTNVL